jgi:hypothetical protein
MGRPSTFTQTMADEIAERLGNGEPLAQICRDVHMPALRTVYDWQDKHEDFSASIARARDAGYDHIAADGLKIVDNLEEDPASRRVRADYRLKLLAKWDARRYGDKLDVTTDGKPITTEIDETARAMRMAAILKGSDADAG